MHRCFHYGSNNVTYIIIGFTLKPNFFYLIIFTEIFQFIFDVYFNNIYLRLFDFPNYF